MCKRAMLSRSVAVILMIGQFSGCTGWRVEPLSPAAAVERQRPSEVRVQLGDGRREVLYHPEVRGDSLLGHRDWSAQQPDRALALTDVKVLETNHISGGRTAALVLGVGAIVGVIVAVQNIHFNLGNWGNMVGE